MLKKFFFNNYNLLTILGPTATGKTKIATHLAYELDAEIISADSRQVYKGMDIGTGKDLEDYIVNGKKISYHLIDILPAGSKYNIFNYQKDFFAAFEKIKNKNKIPILCGGSGLYIDAIVRNYKLIDVPQNNELRNELEKKSLTELTQILASLKKLHNKTEIDTKQRVIRAIEIEIYLKKYPEKRPDYPHIKSLNIGIYFDRHTVKQRISTRLTERLENGMIEEIKNLLQNGVSADDLIYYGLEYKYVTLYLLNKLSYEEMKKKLEIAIHQFSKRQMTFFRYMEKNGVEINWIDGSLPIKKILKQIKSLMQKNKPSF